jgi:hypothetical protein
VTFTVLDDLVGQRNERGRELDPGCRRELCRNSSGAISGMNIVLGQATRSIVSFVTDAGESVFQPSTLRMVI